MIPLDKIMVLMFLWGLSACDPVSKDATLPIDSDKEQATHIMTRWPGGATAALALTYDDSLSSHLDYVIPALDSANLTGTFYLSVDRPSFTERVEEWRAAAQTGHELGNHTLYHPCQKQSKPDRDWVPENANLDSYSVETMVREVRLTNAILKMVDGKTSRTIAYPCGDTEAGGESYIRAIAPFVTAGRTVENSTMNPEEVERMYVPSMSATERNAEQLITYAQAVLESKGIGTLTFHGVGAEYLVLSEETHAALIDWIKEHDGQLYVDSLENIMQHKAHYDAAGK